MGGWTDADTQLRPSKTGRSPQGPSLANVEGFRKGVDPAHFHLEVRLLAICSLIPMIADVATRNRSDDGTIVWVGTK